MNVAALALASVLAIGFNPATGERTANYRCADGPSFSMVYEKKGSVLVMLGGGAYRLKPVGSNRWSDGQGQTLVVSDAAATWTSGVDGVKTCDEVED